MKKLMHKMSHGLPLPALLYVLLSIAPLAIHTPHAQAAPGHDHGDQKSALTAPGAPGAPRFNAHSELFELVGVVHRGTLTLYLDRYADNTPVTAGAIELEIKPVQGTALILKATPDEEGVFTAALAMPFGPGAYAITATVNATLDGKTETDLLAATFDISSGQSLESRSHQHSTEYVAIAAALAAIVGALAWWKLRRRRGLPPFGGVR